MAVHLNSEPDILNIKQHQDQGILMYKFCEVGREMSTQKRRALGNQASMGIEPMTFAFVDVGNVGS